MALKYMYNCTLLPKLKLFSKTAGQEREPKLLRLSGRLNITVKVVFELAYTVTINTLNETIDIIEKNNLCILTRPLLSSPL